MASKEDWGTLLADAERGTPSSRAHVFAAMAEALDEARKATELDDVRTSLQRLRVLSHRCERLATSLERSARLKSSAARSS